MISTIHGSDDLLCVLLKILAVMVSYDIKETHLVFEYLGMNGIIQKLILYDEIE